jgi:hypothetical protein
MFRAYLRPLSGGRTAFHCQWFSVLFIVVVMLESRVVRCVQHCDEDVAKQHPRHSAGTINRTENHIDMFVAAVYDTALYNGYL